MILQSLLVSAVLACGQCSVSSSCGALVVRIKVHPVPTQRVWLDGGWRLVGYRSDYLYRRDYYGVRPGPIHRLFHPRDRMWR